LACKRSSIEISSENPCMSFLITYRRHFLLSALVLSVVLAWFAKEIRVDFSFDSFNPKEDPEYQFYAKYKALFPHDDNAVQIAFSNPSGSIWEPEFLGRVDAAFEDFRRLPHLDTVLSPTRLLKFKRAGMALRSEPLFDWNNDSSLTAGRLAVEQDSLLYVNFFSEDKQHIAGFLMVDTSILDLPARDDLSNALRAKVASTGLPHVISGVPYIRTQYVERIEGELIWFLGFSVLLSLAVMFWLFREWHGILLPQLVVVLTMIWLLGFMVLMGNGLDLMSELLPSILFVVGISDTVHLATSYQQNLKAGLAKIPAMRATLDEVGVAAFLTCLTTAIGFGSMYISPMPPLRDFGLFAAVAVIFAFILTVALLPSVLLSIPEGKIRDSRGFSNKGGWEKSLEKTYHFVKRNTRPILIGFAALLAVSGLGISLISTDTYLLDDVSQNDPARSGMRFFEDNFYGTRSFEMAVQAKNGASVTDVGVLKDLEKIENHLRSQAKISPFFSVVSYLKGANQLMRGGRAESFRLPSSQEKVDELIGLGYTSGGGEALKQVLNPDQTIARLSARMGDIGTYRFTELRNSLEKFIRENCNSTSFDYHITGNAILAENNVNMMRAGLLEDILFSFAMISLLMGLLFRNWKMLLVAIVPNIIPLFVTAGIMGFTGITLRASTSIVFLVAFGIAVDDTIHFLSRFRMELKEGHDRETALLNSLTGTGKAMLITALVLLSGFTLLLTSDFGATFIVGLFTALTLAVAILSDMLLLPVLIRIAKIGPDSRPESPNDPKETDSVNLVSEKEIAEAVV